MSVRLKTSVFCTALLGLVIVANSLAEIAGPVPLTQSQLEIRPVAGPASLTISGKNYWHRQFYSAGDYPQVSEYDFEGALLPDGIYAYEFRSIAGPKEPEDPLGSFVRAHSSPTVAGGAFEIRGGALLIR